MTLYTATTQRSYACRVCVAAPAHFGRVRRLWICGRRVETWRRLVSPYVCSPSGRRIPLNKHQCLIETHPVRPNSPPRLTRSAAAATSILVRFRSGLTPPISNPSSGLSSDLTGVPPSSGFDDVSSGLFGKPPTLASLLFGLIPPVSCSRVRFAHRTCLVVQTGQAACHSSCVAPTTLSSHRRSANASSVTLRSFAQAWGSSHAYIFPILLHLPQ